jgi:hypothetical protein
MRRRLLSLPVLAALVGLAGSGNLTAAEQSEVVLVSGGVSLHKWEQYKSNPHDRWWMNFVRAARIRIQQIRAEEPGTRITWFVYRPAYVRRSVEEGKDLIRLVDSVRDAYRVNRVYFSKAQELIDYLNHGKNRERIKVGDFEYFGHSNKACWMFDYSNFVDSASKSWLHQDDLKRLAPGIFEHQAYVRSWGCHTGESMSRQFQEATGVPLWGAIGKTQYRTDELPMLCDRRGKWTR